ncbi:hypothetical protein [Streptomyces virginiae]|uniref:hypothetical protein n=1 Tax=Streptomyces virginiae TaxID=1961 RepID=UPI0036644D06
MAEETAENRDSLRVIMTAPDVPARWPRVAVRRLAERTARGKLTGRLVRRSPLSDILELAAMRLGVEGKASLWRCLGILAERQAAVPEGLWNEAVARAFAATAAAARTSLGRARGDGGHHEGRRQRRRRQRGHGVAKVLAADRTVTDGLGVARRRPGLHTPGVHWREADIDPGRSDLAEFFTAHFLQGNVTCSLRTLFFWSGRWSVTYPVTALAFLGAGMSTT